jgi:predicted GIY-YIG superfamily endonuclease
MTDCYVYILRCADGSYYTGTARKSLEQRLAEHNAGTLAGFTSTRLPVELLYSESFAKIKDAIAAERKIKGWSRVKKEALIAGRLDLLPGLSKRRKKRP